MSQEFGIDINTTKAKKFELWWYRQMLRILETEYITNKSILEQINKNNNGYKSQFKYLGHIMKNKQRYDLLQLVLQEKIDGERCPDRRGISWSINLRTWFSTTTSSGQSVMIDGMVANIR